MSELKTFAVVTGASQGLGKCFALELAKRGINTILVSLPAENLVCVMNQVREMGTESYMYETDLSYTERVLELSQWINTNYDVNILINNAGRGGSSPFIESSVNYINGIIQLNIKATVLLTHQLLPNLMRQEKGYVLNISSMASYTPTGLKTVYPASKRFIQHFTRGLYQELRHTNVFVSVALPGPMKTNADVSRRIDRQGVLGHIGLLSPEEVAGICVRQLFRRDTLIMLGWANKINWLILNVLPVPWKMSLMTRAVSREILWH